MRHPYDSFYWTETRSKVVHKWWAPDRRGASNISVSDMVSAGKDSYAQTPTTPGNESMTYFKYRYSGLTERTTNFLLSFAVLRNVTPLLTLVTAGHCLFIVSRSVNVFANPDSLPGRQD